jgi:hypothetical protein
MNVLISINDINLFVNLKVLHKQLYKCDQKFRNMTMHN